MLAKIDVAGNDFKGAVTVTLKNGKQIKADLGDVITITENSTGLASSVAEHAAGVAWAMAIDEGADTVPWRRLVDRASQSLKDFEKAKLRLN